MYGGTPAGIAAALEAKRHGMSVVLVSRDRHVGGMSANGLGYADTGNHEAIGGLAARFYRDVRAHYAAHGVEDLPLPQDVKAGDDPDAMYVFEPHVAARIYEEWLAEAGIEPVRAAPLDRAGGGVEKSGESVRALRTTDGRTFGGKVFVDASYEGDLLAECGVSFVTGREANRDFDETLNGVQNARSVVHQFDLDVDPYNVPGQPLSGLLPNIEPGPADNDGDGDDRIQAYNFRLCMTTREDLRVPFAKPTTYDPREYELLARYLDAGWRDLFRKHDPIPNGKTDTNNYGAFSTDFIGGSQRYPAASDAERLEIVAAHRAYTEGLLWFLQNDPRTPADVRALMRPWGLCRDEFADNGHWPRELYVREARRMRSDFVMTERHICGHVPTDMSIGMGSYTMDSHNVRRFVDARGFARNEGDVQVNAGRAYAISYRAITPRGEEASNLLVPVALSVTHIAFGSVRMEPVFTILGQSAGAAAALAVRRGVAVQDVPYEELGPLLVAAGQILEIDR